MKMSEGYNGRNYPGWFQSRASTGAVTSLIWRRASEMIERRVMNL